MRSSVKESSDCVSCGSSVLCAVSIGSGVGLGSVLFLLLVMVLMGLCSFWCALLVSSQGWGGGVVGRAVQSCLVRRSPDVLSNARAFLLSSCVSIVSGSSSSALVS